MTLRVPTHQLPPSPRTNVTPAPERHFYERRQTYKNNATEPNKSVYVLASFSERGGLENCGHLVENWRKRIPVPEIRAISRSRIDAVKSVLTVYEVTFRRSSS